MDTNVIKLLLDSQERALQSAMNVVVEQFQARISFMETTISDLTKSLEFTQAEVHDIKREAENFKRSNYDNEAKIQYSENKIMDLVERFNYQEDYSRRNNLRISGLEEPLNNETWEQTSARVSELFLNKLQLPIMNWNGLIEWVLYRCLARAQWWCVSRGSVIEAVLRNARKLKGTRIFINEDLCAASQAKKQSQFPLMKKARSQGKIAYFKYTRLIIKDRMGQQSNGASGDMAGTPGQQKSGASGGMAGVSGQQKSGASNGLAGASGQQRSGASGGLAGVSGSGVDDAVSGFGRLSADRGMGVGGAAGIRRAPASGSSTGGVPSAPTSGSGAGGADASHERLSAGQGVGAGAGADDGAADNADAPADASTSDNYSEMSKQKQRRELRDRRKK